MASSSSSSRTYSVGELFCGAGGLSRGFHRHGFAPLFANDAWDVALHTFLQNFDEAFAAGKPEDGRVLALPGSVEDLDGESILSQIPAPGGKRSLRAGDLDVLLGGPPCQGYSVNSHNRSSDDPRNHLFKHYIRLLRGISPKVFVLENVPGMFSLEEGQLFEELIAGVTAPSRGRCPGYEVDFKILNAAHYGVPQERFRIVVVGTRRDIAAEVGRVLLPQPVHYSLAQAHFKGGRSHTFHYAIGHKRPGGQQVIPMEGVRLLPPLSVRAAIDDLPPLANGGGVNERAYSDAPAASRPATPFQREMRAGARVLTNHWCRELMPPNTERVKHIPVGGDWRSIPRELLPPGMQRALRKDHTTRYGRLDPDTLAGTLLTKPDPHWGTFLHYDLSQQRLISVREAARIQSFPDTHTFIGSQVDQYRLVGNAVPPLMAEAVAVEVQRTLDRFYALNEHARGRGSSSALARA